MVKVKSRKARKQRKVRRDSLTRVQLRSIASRYKRGESSIKIAEHFGVTNTSVIRWLRLQKVKIRGRGRYSSNGKE